LIELTVEQRQELARRALDWSLKYFAEQAALPIYPKVGADELSARFAAALPLEPENAAAVMAEFEHVVANARHNGHPRMFGYVQSSGSFAGAIGDLLASALNQNVTSWRSAPSATTVEHQVIAWLKEMVGFDAGGTGVLLSGGSFANFTALAAALRSSTTIDLNHLGVGALPGKPRIYTSTMTHMSIAKAASLLGLGKDAIVALPIDDKFRMDPQALADQIAADRAAGHHLICAVATAGDVNTGAIDPLDAIADVCAANTLWLHVDGSYGALAAQSPRVAGAMRGLGRADSLSLDPHKWLYAPVDAGCLLVRDGAALRRAFSEGADYIDVVADRTMSDFAYWDHGPELSRRFRALKIWFILKIHGARAIQQAIDANIDAAQHLARAVEQSSDFELLAPAPLSIVCFRYRGRLHGAASTSQADLDAFNKRLMVEVQRDGESYLSNAMIPSTPSSRPGSSPLAADGRFALRACIVNYRTTRADVERLLDTIRRVAARIAGENERV
jgi:glutamate/tyrosine decarboxylase-like PLP-dependent enzyme